MREKVVNSADFIVKILSVLVSVYFVSSLVYRNIYICVSLDLLMYLMSAIVIVDYVMYALDTYKINYAENKIIRGCIWTITACVCNVKILAILFAVSLLFWLYISNEKRRKFDFSFTFMVACFGMEIISVIDIMYDCEYRHGAKMLNSSLAVDILTVISVLMYIYSDKIFTWMAKLPAIERMTNYNSVNFNEETLWQKRMTYVGVILIGLLLGLHTYNSFVINKDISRIFILSLMMILQIVIVYFLYDKICSDLGRTVNLFIAVITVCLPYINCKNYSLKMSLIYCSAFAIWYCCFKFIKNKKWSWIIATVLAICAVAFLVVNGYYIIPFINVGIGILLGKIFKKKECYLIILCIILIICGQVLFDYKYITPMKEYDEVINTCYDINEKVDVDMFYVGGDSHMIKMLKDGDITFNSTTCDNITESGVIIFDAAIPEKYIIHKYVVLEDNQFIVCFNDESLAENYQNMGGKYSKKECDAQLNIDYKQKTHMAEVTVSNVTEGYHDLSVAVWKGNEEPIWYNFVDHGDGQFQVNVKLKKYKENERINFHIYGTFEQEDPNIIIGSDYLIPAIEQ